MNKKDIECTEQYSEFSVQNEQQKQGQLQDIVSVVSGIPKLTEDDAKIYEMELSRPLKSNDLISSILNRERKITSTKLEMIRLWISQGEDFKRLQDMGYSRNRLSEMTGLSKGLVSNYLKLSRDKRLVNFVNTTGHHGDHLEDMNQKQVLKLTKLDDKAFYNAIETGAILFETKAKKNHSVTKQSRSAPKAVVQYRNGKQVAIYRSAYDASRATGIDRMSIGKVCRQVTMYAGGYSWKFAHKVYGYDNKLIVALEG